MLEAPFFMYCFLFIFLVPITNIVKENSTNPIVYPYSTVYNLILKSFIFSFFTFSCSLMFFVSSCCCSAFPWMKIYLYLYICTYIYAHKYMMVMVMHNNNNNINIMKLIFRKINNVSYCKRCWYKNIKSIKYISNSCVSFNNRYLF